MPSFRNQRAMSQAASHLPLIAEAWILFQAKLYGICG
jgi:hypothetical protein